MRKSSYLLVALAFLLMISIGVSVPSSSAQDRKPVTVPLLGAPFGSGGYAMSFATAELSKRHPWLMITAAETPGYVYNIRAHHANQAQWKTHIIGTSTCTFFLAENGLPPVGEKIAGYRMLVNNEIIAPFLVTLNPNIKTLDDLVGKSVGLGLIAQILWGVSPLEHIKAAGLADSIRISHVGPMPAMHALLDGTIDASIAVVNSNPLTGEIRIPPMLIELLAAGRKVYYIPFEEKVIDKLNAKGWPGVKLTLPAGSLQHQAEDLLLNATLFGWAAKEVFPEDLAYEITKLHLDNVQDFGQYHSLAQLFTKEFLAWGFTKDLAHPGAVRAFTEAGIPIPD